MLLIFKKDGKKNLISSFKEVGMAWKSIPFEVKRAGQIDQIVNSQFDNFSSYDFLY